MNFDVSRRFQTKATVKEITSFLQSSFMKSAGTVSDNGSSLIVQSINPTFGSINRSDRTAIEIKSVDSDIVLVANVTYKPSTWFWVFVVIGLFTTIAWVIPIAFYLYQKGMVKNGIEEVFNRTETEFRGENSTRSVTNAASSEDVFTQLEKLGALKEKGLLSDEEFASQKAKLMGTL